MTYHMRITSFIGLLLGISALAPAFAAAQVIAPAPGQSSASPACLALTRNLSYGTAASSDVFELQGFLYAHGYFSSAVTGPFGPLTRAAVKRFQADSGVPATGFVGALTRAALRLHCLPTGAVSIQSISPTSGPVGTTVTVAGSGFTSDNTIHFGTGVIVHVAAANAIYSCPMMTAGSTSSCGSAAQTLTFTVPNGLDPACAFSTPRCYVASRVTTPGDYSVTVENANGTSAPVTFTVTSTSTNAIAPVIYSIAPTAGPVGTTLSITGRGFTDDNMVHFGNGVIAHVPVSSSIAVACTTDPSCIPGIRQTLTITVPSSVGPYCAPGMMCPMYLQLVTPGTYGVSVENSNGTSGTANFTVTNGTATSSTLAINSITPGTAAPGQTVTIKGSGFSPSASLNIYKNGQPYGTLGAVTITDDSTATFTVADWIGAYCHHGAMCIMLAKNWPAGSYTVSLESAFGESNQVAFTVGSGTSAGPISITGIEAPAALAMGTTGTWIVHTSVPSDIGTVHYQVNWGDSVPASGASIMAPQVISIQNNSTFTHSYARAGTYAPLFTVSDDAGHSASVSSTVTVTPWY